MAGRRTADPIDSAENLKDPEPNARFRPKAAAPREFSIGENRSMEKPRKTSGKFNMSHGCIRLSFSSIR